MRDPRPPGKRYYANQETGEVHDLFNEMSTCHISEIQDGKIFTPDSHTQAKNEGYTDCGPCIVQRPKPPGSAADQIDDGKEQIWQNMIAERPELEHLVVEIPEPNLFWRVVWWVRIRLGI